MILLLTSDMRSDLLSLRPLHITEPLAEIVQENLYISILIFKFGKIVCYEYSRIKN